MQDRAQFDLATIAAKGLRPAIFHRCSRTTRGVHSTHRSRMTHSGWLLTPAVASLRRPGPRADAETVDLIRQPERSTSQPHMARVLQIVEFVTSPDSEIGQGLLTLTPRNSSSEQVQVRPPEEIHILSIKVTSLPEDLRNALIITRDEHTNWLTSAAGKGRSLLVLRTDDSVDFYTTNRDRFVALRPVIESLAARVKNVPELGKTRTVERCGTDAARHLMVHAARQIVSGSTHPGSSIHGAAALSAASTALGPTLGSLFRAAANVGRRVRQETTLHDSNIDPALQEMETFVADRIVEEELATWQAQEAEIQRATSEIPRVAPPRSSFEKQEPVSEVRLRVGTSITPRISYLLEPKTASS